MPRIISAIISVQPTAMTRNPVLAARWRPAAPRSAASGCSRRSSSNHGRRDRRGCGSRLVQGPAAGLIQQVHAHLHSWSRGRWTGGRYDGRAAFRAHNCELCGCLQADDLANGAGDLIKGLAALSLGRVHGVQDTVPEVIVEQPDGYFLQRASGGGDLGHHVGAPGIGLDHPLQAADLALHLAEPGEVVILPGGIAAVGAPGRAGAGRRAALISPLALTACQGGHCPLPAPVAAWWVSEPIRPRSRSYSSGLISPLATRWSRMRRASLPLSGVSGLRVRLVITA